MAYKLGNVETAIVQKPLPKGLTLEQLGIRVANNLNGTPGVKFAKDGSTQRLGSIKVETVVQIPDWGEMVTGWYNVGINGTKEEGSDDVRIWSGNIAGFQGREDYITTSNFTSVVGNLICAKFMEIAKSMGKFADDNINLAAKGMGMPIGDASATVAGTEEEKIPF